MTRYEPIRTLEKAVQILGIDPREGLQIIDAARLCGRHHPPFDLGLPALVFGLCNQPTAQAVGAVLSNAYPDDHPLQLIDPSGKRSGCARSLPLAALSAQSDLTGRDCLYVPALPRASYADLQEVMAHLRAPYGCPWDREQTLATVRAYLLDEAAEALEALDAGDDRHIAEELGDVLGIVAMIAQIAAEEGRFQMADAVRLSVEKLVRRHPHVFGDDEFENIEQLYVRWEEIKAEERAAQQQPARGPLDAVPAALPALRKAREIQSKAHKAALLDRAALAQSDPALARLLPEGSDEQALGLLLWRLVALSRERGLDAEDALRAFTGAWRAQVTK